MKFFYIILILSIFVSIFSATKAADSTVYLEENLNLEKFFEINKSDYLTFQQDKITLEDNTLSTRHPINFANTYFLVKIEPDNWSNQGIFGINFLVDGNNFYSLVFNSLSSHIYLKKNFGSELLTIKKKPHIFTVNDTNYSIRISVPNNEINIWLNNNKIIWDDSEDYSLTNSNSIGKLSLFSEYETNIFSEIQLLPNYPTFISPIEIFLKDKDSLGVSWNTSHPTSCQIAYDIVSRANENNINNYIYKSGSPNISRKHNFILDNIIFGVDYYIRIKCGLEQITITDEQIITLPNVLGATILDNKTQKYRIPTILAGSLTLITFALFILTQKKKLKLYNQLIFMKKLRGKIKTKKTDKLQKNKIKKIYPFDTISK